MMRRLHIPIDNAPLIIFRMFFGFLLFAETFGAILTGWVRKTLVEPEFTFSHIGLEWLQPLPGNGMYFYFATMSIFGLMVMVGFKYRWSLGAFTIMWAGVYFMQKESYNNHYYLLLLICIIMLVLPANRYASADVRRHPQLKQLTMPQWCSWVLILQISIVYVFAVVSKLYPQWLDGTFIKALYERPSHPEFLRPLFHNHIFHLFISYAGILFDLLIVPLLFWKRTRTIAFICAIVFHLFNAAILQIGIFPFFALSFTVFFYPGERIRAIFFKNKPAPDSMPMKFNDQRLLLYFFVPYFILQLVLPLRHHLIEGDVLWTEEGHRLSWRMMLRHRDGYAQYKVVNKATGQVYPYMGYDALSPKQKSLASTRPDGIWQLAQRIKKEYAGRGIDVQVFVNSSVSINGGPYQRLIDPNTDLATAKWDYFWHNDWVLLHDPASLRNP